MLIDIGREFVENYRRFFSIFGRQTLAYVFSNAIVKQFPATLELMLS